MGASCCFRVFDNDGLIAGHVRRANRTGIFPEVYIQVWLHFSDDAREIDSMVYGDQLFGGFATRIELDNDARGSAVAKIWGGHEGIAASKLRVDAEASASVVGRIMARPTAD